MCLENDKMYDSVSIGEQETHINWMRDEDFAYIYTSDTTQMTRLDKLCRTSPDIYSLVKDCGRAKTYLLKDKTLVSFRSRKKEVSEEQRAAAGERMRQYQEQKRAQDA